MKIKFVEGTIVTHKGSSAIWNSFNKSYVRGYFQVTRISEYTYFRTRRTSEEIKKEIVVVKQKSKWQMFRILIHELFHWFIFTFITPKNDNKYDKWLDR